MKETFEGETQNVIPPQFPAPNPPADELVWSQQLMQPKVVSKPGGGQWVVIGAKEALQEGRVGGVLSAISEPLKKGIDGSIRGGLTMQLEGPGTVVVFLLAWDEGSTPLGGFAIHNLTLVPPQLSSLNSQDAAVWLSDPFKQRGTGMGNYSAGKPVEFSWSIDQRAPFLRINASPGGSAGPIDITKVATNGKNIFPAKKMFILINAYGWSRNTRLFIDDVKIEEL
ncbi:MAG: hypothetical protein ABIN97_04745 [Ginsengibacter sp.]